MEQVTPLSTTVILTLREYQSLKNSQLLLRCLKACGVDNWVGYSAALELMDEEIDRLERHGDLSK